MLNEGEYFETCTTTPHHHTLGRFASYAGAYTAAETLQRAHAGNVTIRIMVPDVDELRGKDANGCDTTLVTETTYRPVAIIPRIHTTNTARKESTHLA